MRSMGLVISKKSGEKRRALLPVDIVKNIKNTNQLFVERGYGETVDVTDEEYAAVGCKIVSREEALACDIICDVKLGDADYLDLIEDNKILFGWAHAVQNVNFTSNVIEHNQTVIAWEEMYEDGRYILYRNREVAGEAAVMHAFRYYGKMPYDAKVAILGNGQTAKGAMRVLHGLGADIDVYSRKHEELFKKKMYEYDVLINCVMWDTNRTDRIIYKDDLKKLKKGAMIIDVSCDPYLEIETSHPTTIDDPVYVVDGIVHYAVDNTPAMYHKTVTKILSENLSKYVDQLLCDEYNETVNNAIVIDKGHIKSENILKFRQKRNLFCK